MYLKLTISILLISFIIPVFSENYFVSPNGKDSNKGNNPSAPFRNISAASQKATAGDTIFIYPGNYSERIFPLNSGKEDAPIIYQKKGAQGSVILTTPLPDIPNENKLYAFILANKSYIRIEGIDFKDCNGWIYLEKSSHITISNCTFDGSRVYSSCKINNSSYNKILHCKFIKAVEVTWKGWEPARGADFITMWRDSHYNRIEGCLFSHIPHDCIGIHGREPQLTATHNIIRNCVFDNPTWKAIGLHKTEYTLVENNVCFGDAANFLQFEAQKVILRHNLFYRYHDTTKGLPETGFRGVMRIQSVKDEYGCANLAQHNRIYNNLFYGNERTITNFSVRLPVFDNEFKNNIFYKNLQSIQISNSDYRNINKNYYRKNILSGSEANLIKLQQDSYSLKEAQNKLPELYQNNIDTDPKFVGESSNDFHLSKGSPCIDQGAELTRTLKSGKGTVIKVEDALYFTDGYGLIEGDKIRIGRNSPIKIVKIDYENGILTLAKGIKWKAGDPVNLDYKGKGPDIGPLEF